MASKRMLYWRAPFKAQEIGMEACAVTDREKPGHYTDRHLLDTRASFYIETQ